MTHQGGLADLEAAAAAADPMSMEPVFFWEMIALGAPIARRVFRGVTDWKLVWGSAPAAVMVAFQSLFVCNTYNDLVNAVCVLLGDDHAGCTNSL